MIKLIVKNGVLIKFITDETDLKIRLPKTVKIIDSGAFSNCDAITCVDVGEGVQKILSSAFSNCKNLKHVVLGPNVTILDSAICDCPKVERLSLSPNLQYCYAPVDLWDDKKMQFCQWMEQDGVYYLGNLKDVGDIEKNILVPCGNYYDVNNSALLGYVQRDGEPLPTTYNILEGTKFIGIGGNAFGNQTSLTDIVIPEGAISIQNNFFFGCVNLQHVTLPNSLRIIEYQAFYDCDNLVTKKYKGGCYLGNPTNPYLAIVGWEDSAKFAIHPKTKIIGPQALSYFDGKSITIPAGVVSICDNAFECSDGLEEVKFAFGSQLDYLGHDCFSQCYNLKSIALPDAIQTIPDSAFYDCCSLEQLKLPANLQEICSYAFNSCGSLRRLDIPDSVWSMDNCAFNGCSKLEQVNFGPNSQLIKLGYSVFGGRDEDASPLSLKLPQSVCLIDYGAFGHQYEGLQLELYTKMGWYACERDNDNRVPFDGYNPMVWDFDSPALLEKIEGHLLYNDQIAEQIDLISFIDGYWQEGVQLPRGGYIVKVTDCPFPTQSLIQFLCKFCDWTEDVMLDAVIEGEFILCYVKSISDGFEIRTQLREQGVSSVVERNPNR